ncbi:MAG: NADH-quinone oxidoreductase subunit N [Dehalococcoidia bacterium]|jgi:NADH-quinone oxidoreductase subunit N|nr:NADH-quinone oxidoreductase subunit N [Dehalococcoidia bacterium]
MRWDWSLLAPEYVLAGWAALVVTVGLWGRVRASWLGYLSAVGALAATATSLIWLGDRANFGGLLDIDSYTTFFRVTFGLIAVAVCLMSARYVEAHLRHPGEYYGLVLVAVIGATYMAAARELLTAYISLELLSFSLYVLTSFAKMELRSNEGGLKYMLLGAFSSAIFLYGLGLVYALARTTQYGDIAEALAGDLTGLRGLALLGLVLVVAGLGFKVSAVPFHMWAPDAYEGAPMPVTAFISAISKAAGFALFLKVMVQAFLPLHEDWRPLLAALATVTMLLGNLVALHQRNVKRLLAYSSIGQVGYLLAGIAALSPERMDAASAVVLHLAGYVISNLAAFACAIVYYNWTGEEDIYGYRGMAERAPFLALTFSISLFSLAGMPLFAGFVTKFVLFQAIAEEGMVWLAAVAVFASFVSLYYYLMVMRQMYVVEPAEGGRFRVPWLEYGLVAVLVVAIFVVGLGPQPLFNAAQEAVSLVYQGAPAALAVRP